MSECFDSIMDKLGAKYEAEMQDAYRKGFTDGCAKAMHDSEKDKKFGEFEAFGRGYSSGLHDAKQKHDYVLPHPCDGPLYKDWGAGDYIEKVREEFDEFMEAFREWRKHPSPDTWREVCEESTDMIIAAVGVQDKIGCNKRMRANFMRQKNYSNAQRDGGKRFKDNVAYVTPEEKQEIRREIYEDMGEYDET